MKTTLTKDYLENFFYIKQQVTAGICQFAREKFVEPGYDAFIDVDWKMWSGELESTRIDINIEKWKVGDIMKEHVVEKHMIFAEDLIDRVVVTQASPLERIIKMKK